MRIWRSPFEMWKGPLLFLGLFFFQPVSDHSEAEDGNGSIAKQGNDERDDEVCGVGNDAHQKESAAAHRCHHEEYLCSVIFKNGHNPAIQNGENNENTLTMKKRLTLAGPKHLPQ